MYNYTYVNVIFAYFLKHTKNMLMNFLFDVFSTKITTCFVRINVFIIPYVVKL